MVQTLRKLVLLLAVAFFLLLLLVITNLLSVDFLDREFTHFNPQNFFKVLALVGAGLLGLALAVEQAHAAFLQRRVRQLETSVAQLKASLYDAQQRAMADALTTPSTLHSTPATAPGATASPADTTGLTVPPPSGVPGETR